MINVREVVEGSVRNTAWKQIGRNLGSTKAYYICDEVATLAEVVENVGNLVCAHIQDPNQ